MGRTLLGVVAAFLVLAAAMIARTLMVSAPEVVTSAPSINIDGMAVARHLAEAVRFKTISYGGGTHETEKDAALAAMRDWLAATYPKFSAVAKREVIGQSLLYTWQGKNPKLKPILLMAHMDVVPVVPGTAKDWVHPPFSGDIAGGYVWGRGSIDDKGVLIAIMEACERLAASGFTPERTVMIAAGQDEETGGENGNAVIAKMLASGGVRLDWVLDEGGAILDDPFPGMQTPAAFVAVAEKGYLTLELVAHGEGGHSSRPTHDMAVTRLASSILKLTHHPFASGIDNIEREQLHALAPYVPFAPRILLANLWISAPIIQRFMEMQPETAALLHTTIAPTMLNAGVKDNVLPPTAHATINFRIHPRDTIDDVIEHVRRAIDDPKVDINVMTQNESEASKVADIHGPSYRFLVREIQDSFGDIPVAPVLAIVATDSRHYLPIADNVFRLDPFHFGPNDLARVHGTNERLAVGDLAPAVGFYIRLMKDAQ
jgi:carboxypeptidase PM20D1